MNPLHVGTSQLTELMSGSLSLLVAQDLPGLDSLAVPGVALWVFAPRGDQLVVQRHGAPLAEGEALLRLSVPPMGVVCVVASQAEQGEALAQWWLAASGLSAPLVVAADAAQAMPEVLARMAGEFAQANRRCVDLERSLAETRVDYEDTRIAIAALSRTLGQRPPGPLGLSLALEPSADLVGAAQPGERLFLRQPLGCKLEGLAALALHVGAISAASTGPMRLRVFGAESGTVVASWTVPMAEMVEGWLTLDLPTPLGPDRETAVLEIAADVEGPHSLAFSLDTGWVPAEVACAREDGSEQGRALAMRLWTARLGDRFVVPSYWNWDEAGAALPLLGVAQSLAAAECAAAKVVSGDWLGLEACVAGTDLSVMTLPRVTLAGADVLRLGWTVKGHAPRPLRVGLWVMAPGHDIGALDSLPVEAAFSGWRDAAEERDGLLTMLLPVAFGPQVQIVLAVEGRDAETGARLVPTELSLLSTRDPAQLRSLQAEAAAQLLPPMPAAPSLGRVELFQHLVAPRNYQHLDLVVHGVAGEGYDWPQLRFKLAVGGTGPMLEFRRGEGWPEVFVRWPGTTTDKFGPVVHVRPPKLRNFIDTLAHPRDSALMTTLLALLDRITSEGAGLAKLDEDQAARWRNHAEAMRGV